MNYEKIQFEREIIDVVYVVLTFIDVLQKLPSSQINLYCLSAEISKHQRYRSILHM